MITCIENRLYIKIFNSIKGVKTCVRLSGGNRIISHVSVCKVLKQSATVVELISDSACHLLYIYMEIFPNLK